MKGKIIFVAGAAVGYVLGTRAGRKRYEQIKSGAISLWNSKPVQNGVGQAKDLVADTVGDVPQQIITAGRRAVAKMIGPDETASKRVKTAKTAHDDHAAASSAGATVGKTATQKPVIRNTSESRATTSPASDD